MIRKVSIDFTNEIDNCKKFDSEKSLPIFQIILKNYNF